MREEAFDRCCYFRIVAFAGTAAFEDESVVLTVGDTISGAIEGTSGSYSTDQLSGWKPASAAAWKLRPLGCFLTVALA